VDGAKLVLAARLEEDRDRLGLAQARLDSVQGFTRAARLATGGRRGSATQKRAARLHTRTRLARGRGAHAESASG